MPRLGLVQLPHEYCCNQHLNFWKTPHLARQTPCRNLLGAPRWGERFDRLPQWDGGTGTCRRLWRAMQRDAGEGGFRGSWGEAAPFRGFRAVTRDHPAMSAIRAVYALAITRCHPSRCTSKRDRLPLPPQGPVWKTVLMITDYTSGVIWVF